MELTCYNIYMVKLYESSELSTFFTLFSLTAYVRGNNFWRAKKFIRLFYQNNKRNLLARFCLCQSFSPLSYLVCTNNYTIFVLCVVFSVSCRFGQLSFRGIVLSGSTRSLGIPKIKWNILKKKWVIHYI